MIKRMDEGISRAESYAVGGVSPTYFKYTVTSYEVVGTSKRGLPTVKVSQLVSSSVSQLVSQSVRVSQLVRGRGHCM